MFDLNNYNLKKIRFKLSSLDKNGRMIKKNLSAFAKTTKLLPSRHSNFHTQERQLRGSDCRAYYIQLYLTLMITNIVTTNDYNHVQLSLLHYI